MNPFVIILLSVVVFAGLFGSFYLIYLGFNRNQHIKQVEAHVAVIQDETKVSSQKSKKKLDDSFTARIIIPLAQTVSEWIEAIIPTSGQSWIRKKLIHAGYGKPAHLKTFIGVQAMLIIGPAVLILLYFLAHKITLQITLIAIPIGMFTGFTFPLLWLIDNTSKRQLSIQKAIPDFIDLLVICIEAGLGIDSAMLKITRIDSIETSTHFKKELYRYCNDINLGKTRKDALLDLASRIGIEDMDSVSNALIQAYEMGTGVAQTLRIQSDILRQKRLHRAEEKANKISVKMVMPVYMFFFPGIFIIIFGPILMYAVQQVSKTMGGM